MDPVVGVCSHGAFHGPAGCNACISLYAVHSWACVHYRWRCVSLEEKTHLGRHLVVTPTNSLISPSSQLTNIPIIVFNYNHSHPPIYPISIPPSCVVSSIPTFHIQGNTPILSTTNHKSYPLNFTPLLPTFHTLTITHILPFIQYHQHHIIISKSVPSSH